MAMYTVCSKCNLNLAITVADLRAAQGYVRCGSCHNVFNALIALSDEPAAAADAATRPEAGAAAVHVTGTVMPPAAADREAADALGPRSAGAAQGVPHAPAPPSASQPRPDLLLPEPDAALEFDPIGTDVKRIFVEAAPDEATGTFEAIVLESEEPPPAATVAVQTQASSPESPVTADPGVVQGDEPAGTAAGEGASGEAAAQLQAGADGTEPEQAAQAPTVLAQDPPPPQQDAAAVLAGLSRPAAVISRSTRALLYLAALALALVLGAQILHHYRSELAGYAPLSHAVTALYASLGLRLQPRWDVSAYDVRQLGADDSPAAGALVVRASLRNTAARAQPLPLLRVTVQDRFGNRLAGRDVLPQEYLPHQGLLMAAGQRVDTQVSFVDPGPQVAGFEIDACLRLSSGRIVCANDPGR